MPIYDYDCPVCQKAYSEVRGINEDTKLINCDNCNVKLIRRYNVSVAFKGNGFYTTDKKEK